MRFSPSKISTFMTTNKAKTSVGHFVYIYRDENRKIRYVGYGKGSDRAMPPDHSPGVRKFVDRSKFTLEIAGPYGSSDTGKAVETALISVLDAGQLLNSSKSPGPTHFRFRPLGVPEAFAERLVQPALERRNLASIGPVLFIFISKMDFDGDDPRPGYSLDEPPPDSAILARMKGWWQLGRHVAEWKRKPQQSPRVLVGVAGPPSHRIIIGAVAIDQQGWTAQPEKGLYPVPTIETSQLDACELRGRLISPKAKIKFGALRHQLFVILKRNGRTEGGQK